ncbi:hypothetical protein PCANC_26255 [Puccinia coronata f. sp. avenae]|nr:hypothetical protein PCANC_26255 [Puccinia coronata f. sp. avenae]
MLCSSTNGSKVPYFNAPIYLANKTSIGKVDEILGPINEVYFTIKMGEGMLATSFNPGDKVFIAPDKLLPIERFLPKPPGEKKAEALVEVVEVVELGEEDRGEEEGEVGQGGQVVDSREAAALGVGAGVVPFVVPADCEAVVVAVDLEVVEAPEVGVDAVVGVVEVGGIDKLMQFYQEKTNMEYSAPTFIR